MWLFQQHLQLNNYYMFYDFYNESLFFIYFQIRSNRIQTRDLTVKIFNIKVLLRARI